MACIFPKPIARNDHQQSLSIHGTLVGTWQSLEAPSIYNQQKPERYSRKEKGISKGLH